MKVKNNRVFVKSEYVDNVDGFLIDSSYHEEKSTGVICELLDADRDIDFGNMQAFFCDCFSIAGSIKDDYKRVYQASIVYAVENCSDYDESALYDIIEDVPEYSFERYLYELKNNKVIVKWTGIDKAKNDKSLMKDGNYFIGFDDIIAVLVGDRVVAVNGYVIFTADDIRRYDRGDTANPMSTKVGIISDCSSIDYFVKDGIARESITVDRQDYFIYNSMYALGIETEPYIKLDNKYYYIHIKDIFAVI